MASLASPIADPEEFKTQVLVNALPAPIEGGVLLTVTKTEEEEAHPVVEFVFVTVYEVVDTGFARGLLTVEELNPADGFQA